MTGGRLKRAMPYVGNDDMFALTYGDGVADIDLAAEIAFHRAHGRMATVTAVQAGQALRGDLDRWRQGLGLQGEAG